VNCNPNIDAGNEDQVLGDALYRECSACSRGASRSEKRGA
jgi:hypothetical protein